MRLVYILSTVMLTFVVSASEPTIDLTALPPEVRVEVERALQEAQRARATYLQAIARANEAAVQRLQRIEQNHTRRGNLDGALAVRGVVDAMNAGWAKNEAEAELDLVGNRVVNNNERYKDMFVGRWRSGNVIVEINNNGSVTGSGNLSGRWIQNNNEFTIEWSDGRVRKFVFGENFIDTINVNNLTEGTTLNWIKMR